MNYVNNSKKMRDIVDSLQIPKYEKCTLHFLIQFLIVIQLGFLLIGSLLSAIFALMLFKL